MMEFPHFVIHSVKNGKSMSFIVVGIDLAKNVFALQGVNQTGKPELVKPRSMPTHWPTLSPNLKP